ncbi:unnamed protein product [Candidula unifasciata]|uniref:Uncharacterized protein n=1 Tax=Candidula unifasciata TaxID=100452 RepID=A0A8S4A2P7_9EUPU|nr:unnamed protein product [Candidula unifasciata]
METSDEQRKNPSSKNVEDHNSILNPHLGQTQTHSSFSETAPAPSASASPSAESHASTSSGAAFNSAGTITKNRNKQESQTCEVTEASCALEDSNYPEEKQKMLDQPLADSPKSHKTVIIKKVDCTVEGVPAEVKPELLSIPQTNFAIGVLVMCCFNPPFGLLALYFSLRSAAAYRDGDKTKGAWFARTSIVVSLLGIMLTMVIITSVVLYIAVNKNNARKASRRASSNTLGF